jgi:hypothetical protein
MACGKASNTFKKLEPATTDPPADVLSKPMLRESKS